MFVCGDAQGNLYFKTFDPSVSITEHSDPIIVAQDADWNLEHPDKNHMQIVTIANVIGAREPLTVTVDAAGEVKIWFVNV